MNLNGNQKLANSQILPIHVRMARAALEWTVRRLAKEARVSHDTIVRLEKGNQLKEGTVVAIRSALEAAGVEFMNGDAPGVRLRIPGRRREGLRPDQLTAENDD
jgi:DNA-binding XRE family transcriptional regulator